MTYNFRKTTWWYNNYNLKYFVGNLLSNHLLFLSAITHQLLTAIASNTSIIFARKTHITAALCVYIVILYLFYIKWLFTNTFCSTFKQRIMIRMRMWTCGTLKTVAVTSKTTNFQARFFYSAFLYWLTSLLIVITFLYL